MTVLRRYALWLVLATFAGIAGAWLVRASLPVRYVSTAQVDVEPRVTSVAVPVAPDMGTEQLIATSGVVLASTARTLHMMPGELANDLSASVSGATSGGTAPNVLSISCSRPAAAAAQRCAAAAATGYIAFRNDYGKPRSTQSRDPLKVTLVTAATRPAAPAGPGKRILLPVGALLGLSLGIGAVFIRDRADDRVRDRADLEQCLDAPVPAAISRVRRGHGQRALVFSSDPLSPAADTYRYLREHLSALTGFPSAQGTVLLVAGAQSRDGSAAIAANLAAAWARPALNVLLVDADPRHPAMEEIFGTGYRPGLAEVLVGRSSLEEVAVPDVVPGLSLVTAGQVAAWSPDLFQGEGLAQILQDMRILADVVVVASGPVLGAPHTLSLARVSDLALVVADVRRASRAAAGAAGQQLRVAGQRVIAGVLTGVRSRWNILAWPAATRLPRPLAPSIGDPAVLAGRTPAEWPDGQRREDSAATIPPAGQNPQDR